MSKIYLLIKILEVFYMKNDLTNYDDEEGFFGPLFADWFNFPALRKDEKNLARIMKTDIKESEKGYNLDVEVPGIEKQDIGLELKDGYLVIRATHSSTNDQDKKGYIRRERHFGSYSRSFYVGKDVKEEDISASLDKGVLSIFVPKKQPQTVEHKKIEIK